MLKLIYFVLVVHTMLVESSNVVCLKSYKKKLCLALSVRQYNLGLFQPFVVFEENSQFCVSNTKCVSKTPLCFGCCSITNTFVNFVNCKLRFEAWG